MTTVYVQLKTGGREIRVAVGHEDSPPSFDNAEVFNDLKEAFKRAQELRDTFVNGTEIVVTKND